MCCDRRTPFSLPLLLPRLETQDLVNMPQLREVPALRPLLPRLPRAKEAMMLRMSKVMVVLTTAMQRYGALDPLSHSLSNSSYHCNHISTLRCLHHPLPHPHLRPCPLPTLLLLPLLLPRRLQRVPRALCPTSSTHSPCSWRTLHVYSSPFATLSGSTTSSLPLPPPLPLLLLRHL